MTVPIRFSFSDAEHAGHYFVPIEEGPIYVADCVSEEGERCWSFAPTGTRSGAIQSFLEHAAEEAGVCWACSQPDDGTNVEDCRRCWLMSYARAGVPPSRAPEWPGPVHA